MQKLQVLELYCCRYCGYDCRRRNHQMTSFEEMVERNLPSDGLREDSIKRHCRCNRFSFRFCAWEI